MRRAAERGHEVLFLETGNFLGKHLFSLGRRPSLSLLRRLTTGQRVAPRVTVRKALNVLPWAQRYALAATVNNRINAVLVRRLAQRLPTPVVMWIYDPCAAGAVTKGSDGLVVYDCVDDYPEQVGPDQRRRLLVAAADARAAERAHLVFTTTTPLFERQRRRNPRTYLASNAGDFARFSPAADPQLAASEVAALRRPVLGFVGNIVPTKLDLDLLERLAAGHPEWTLVLVGPSAPELASRIIALASRANVHWFGERPYDELPRYVAAFDVGLVPYVANDYTKSCFPLKVFEYLAAGKPVVATGVPAVSGMEPDVVLVEDVGSVDRAVNAVLELASPEDRERRRRLAAANSWENRAGKLLGLVAEELAA